MAVLMAIGVNGEGYREVLGVSALLCETHEEWITGKLYLNMELLNRKREENRIYRKNVV